MSFLINPYRFGVVPATISNTDNASINSVLTAFTFSAKSLGAADADRKIIIGVAGVTVSPPRTMVSVTVGGITATEIIYLGDLNAGIESYSGLYIASVPTGTTGDVVVTWSGSVSNMGIGVWRVIGASSIADDTGSSVATPVMTDTLNIPAGGIAVGVAHWSVGTAGVTWAGITEDFDGNTDAGNERYSGASDAFATEQVGLTISATKTVGGSRQVLTMASWGPG